MAIWCFPDGTVVKNPPANVGDMVSSLGSGRSPSAGNGNLLQYSCLENSMNRGAWQATVHGITKNQTHLSTRTHTHTYTDTHNYHNWNQIFLENKKSWQWHSGCVWPTSICYNITQNDFYSKSCYSKWFLQVGKIFLL